MFFSTKKYYVNHELISHESQLANLIIINNEGSKFGERLNRWPINLLDH